MRRASWMSCPSHPVFGAVKEDLTVSKLSQHLPLRWSAPDLKVAPEFSQHLSRKTGLLLTQAERDIRPTDWPLVGRRVIPADVFWILSPRLRASVSVTKHVLYCTVKATAQNTKKKLLETWVAEKRPDKASRKRELRLGAKIFWSIKWPKEIRKRLEIRDLRLGA